MAGSNLTQAFDILKEFMKLKKMRMTPERKAVLEAAYSIGTSFTVDMLKAQIDKELNVTRVTVYNNLELFFQAGIVIKRPVGGNAVEYEACIDKQTHHHLVCKMCGQVYEFKDPSIQMFMSAKKFRKFKMTNCAVVVYGICSKCQGRLTRAKRKQKNI